jgi:hypothetical protein
LGNPIERVLCLELIFGFEVCPLRWNNILPIFFRKVRTSFMPGRGMHARIGLPKKLHGGNGLRHDVKVVHEDGSQDQQA